MKKTFIGIMALAISLTAFVSCELDAPEINFSQTTTVEMDFQDVIDAINDMSTTMEQKLETLKDAMESSNLSLEEKLDALETAIDNQTLDLNAKLDAIETAVTNGVADIIKEQELVKDAIIESLDEHFAETQESLDAVNKALEMLRIEGGILPESNRDTLYMYPTTWDALYADEELSAQFARVMKPKVYDLRITGGYQSGGVVDAGWKIETSALKKENVRLAATHKTQIVSSSDSPVEAVCAVYDNVTYRSKLTADRIEKDEIIKQGYIREISSNFYSGLSIRYTEADPDAAITKQQCEFDITVTSGGRIRWYNVVLIVGARQ